ncbi:MAG: FtsX-like permease family protein [Clostridia bacterium]|nr:FtsX-like permease family protein [Clostridia bacterium]
MKKIQFKDALQNIKKQLVSFLSIVLVIALGAGVFLVCRLGSKATGTAADDYYKAQNFRDFEIKSPRGITEDDVKAVAALDFVRDAEGILSFTMAADTPRGREEVNVISPTNKIDKAVLMEGRFPEQAGECAITPETAALLEIGVGDRLKLYDDGSYDRYLKTDTYTVTGIMRHPAKVRFKEVSADTVLLSADAFDADALGVPYTGMLVRADADEFAFSEAYREKIDAYLNRLTLFAKERVRLRDEEIRREAQEKIDESENELSDARAALDDAQNEAAAGSDALSDAALRLESARATLALMKEQMYASEAELRAGKAKLDKAKAELVAAKEKLDDGRRELDEAKAELDNAAREIKENEAKIKAGEKELQEGEKALNDASLKISIAKALIAEVEATIDESTDVFNNVIEGISEDAAAQLIEAIPKIRALSDEFGIPFDEVIVRLAVLGGVAQAMAEQAMEDVRNSPSYLQLKALYERVQSGYEELKSGTEAYDAALAEWERGKEELEKGKAALEEGKAQYNEGMALYLSKESEYSAAVMLYEANLATYESGLAEYESGRKKFNDGSKEIAASEKELSEKSDEFERGKTELKDGQATLEEKEAQYREGVETLEGAKRDLAAMGSGSWIILTRFQNLSFSDFENTASVFGQIGGTFALLFVLLGILVCYATIGKMIDEQKKLLGTVKALGYRPKEIFVKYMLFGVGGTVLGAVVGNLISLFILQPIMLNATKQTLLTETFHSTFEPVSALLTVVICAVVGFSATYFACTKLLKKRPIALLNGEVKASVSKEKIVEDGQKKKSLYAGLILRNIRSDWQHAAITAASTAGCCMLLIIGFSLKFSYSNVVKLQFDQIQKYDATVTFLADEEGKEAEKIGAVLDETAEEKMAAYRFGTVARIGGLMEGVQLVAADPDELVNFTALYDVNKGRNVRIPDGGVMIFNRLAEIYHLSPGDRISILGPRGTYVDVPVAGIYNNYFGLSIFASEAYVRELFGDAYRVNEYFVKSGGRDENAVKDALLQEKSFIQLTTKAEMSARVEVMARTMNITIVVMIVMATILAAVVLLNLVKMQINRKKRELTVMRINGFTIRETANYILKENAILTFVGIALGIVVGAVEARINLAAVENIKMQMIRQVSVPACLISAVITLFFAAAVNYLALRQIKRLELNHIE